ncbi:MAG: M20/M25/M40 family metallo-hydrolase, partial [Ornithinimicrobium sp.]|uniref:M20/M25/M40 family metallo-hydrolase n=1 Tax=Ornithinimicrobium sp. TaxID=1977084 RepID=UPI003D9BDDEB
PQEDQVRALVAEVETTVTDLGGHVEQESWTPTTRFDADLADRLRRVIGEQEGGLLSVPVLGTGAGHDAGILAGAGIPTAMLFVRNPTGVSHSPAEHAERADCHAGVDALTACVTELLGSAAAEGAGPGGAV